MKNYRKWTAWLGAGAVILTIGAGCADKNNDAVPDAASNVAVATANTAENMTDAAGNTATNMADSNGAEAMGNTATAMGNTTSNASGAMSNGASTTMNATGNAAANTGNVLSNLADAATMTPKIKTALGANAAMKGSKINVDTLGSKDSIALRGTVTSAAQKTLAENIAKKNAPGYKIINQLTMGGKM